MRRRVARIVARTDFQRVLLESFTGAGLTVERLWVFQPLDARDAIECLIVDHERGALTVYAGPDGQIIAGPFDGFGHDDELEAATE